VKWDFLLDETMDRHTTFRIGGPADRLWIPRQVPDLATFLRACPEGEALYLIGAGSNILVADAGIRGTVILTKELRVMKLKENRLRVGSGIILPGLLRVLAQEGMAGMECLAGIPGTVGGAVRMNAGTESGCIADRLVAVTLLDRSGHKDRRKRDEIDFGYRSASFPKDHFIVEAEFQLVRDDPEAISGRLRRNMALRKKKQPLSLPSAGSVFKNPPGDHAGRLIEAAGMKGERIGDAEVSPMHANFIVNRGRARAAEVLTLIRRIREKVQSLFGVSLELEIRLMGDFAPNR
jgi:UDP-N-acetylmuramate dehydrogenase